MAIILSDDFTGAAVDVQINGRTLNNALGGSGTRTWQKAAGVAATPEGDGAGGVRQLAGATEQAGVSLGADTNGKARFKFRTSNLAVNFIAFGKSDAAALTGATAAVCALVIASGTTNALRIRNQANTDLASANISALATGTDYHLEIEINGSDVVARLFDGSLSLLQSVSYTYPSSPPAGNYWGFGTLSASNTGWVGDDFVMQNLPAAGGSALLRIMLAHCG